MAKRESASRAFAVKKARMPAPYEFFEHTADIGVTVHGATPGELFRHAAAALYEALGAFELAGPRTERRLALRADSAEDLLHDWLAELLYDLETRHVVYDQIDAVEVTPDSLSATLRGGAIDFARSRTNEEIKAVTYHQLRVEQVPGGAWRARVIFDV
jgi:SHS2 domain-containing protein